MTIQEAIKSGKPFRREAWSKYIRVNEDNFFSILSNVSNEWDDFELDADSILSDDWEVKNDYCLLS